MKKMRNFLNSFSEPVTMTKKDQVLLILIAVLAGCIFGMFCSPRRNQAIVCGNGNGAQNFLEEPEEKKTGKNQK